MLAVPLCTLARQGVRADVLALGELLRRESAVGVVVGLPLGLDGADTRSTRLARQLGEALALASGLPLAWQDERFSTVEAERRLLEVGHDRRARKERIDQVAAAVILQDFMDGPEGHLFAVPCQEEEKLPLLGVPEGPSTG